MISGFRKRALKRLWEKGDGRRLPPALRVRIEMILDRLEVATKPLQMDVPGLSFHSLTGDLKGRYAVTVSANWRVTFGWSGDDAIDLDFEDYH